MKDGHEKTMRHIQAKVEDADFLRYRDLAFKLGITMGTLISDALRNYADFQEAILNSKRKEDSDQEDKTDSEDADGGQEFDN